MSSTHKTGETMHKYMVTISLPRPFLHEHMLLVPKQRAMIVELLASGRLCSFSLDRERKTAWLIAVCKDEEALRAMLKKFPMHRYFEYSIDELVIYDTAFMGLPKMVLN